MHCICDMHRYSIIISMDYLLINMRNGKDSTYRLPILVFSANEISYYYQECGDYFTKRISIESYCLRPHSTSYGWYYVRAYTQDYDINSIISRSSFYRVINNLVDDGYMLKIFHGNSKTPRFYISLKGLLFLIEQKVIVY